MPINGHSRKGSLLVGGEGIDIKKGPLAFGSVDSPNNLLSSSPAAPSLIGGHLANSVQSFGSLPADTSSATPNQDPRKSTMTTATPQAPAKKPLDPHSFFMAKPKGAATQPQQSQQPQAQQSQPHQSQSQQSHQGQHPQSHMTSPPPTMNGHPMGQPQGQQFRPSSSQSMMQQGQMRPNGVPYGQQRPMGMNPGMPHYQPHPGAPYNMGYPGPPQYGYQGNYDHQQQYPVQWQHQQHQQQQHQQRPPHSFAMSPRGSSSGLPQGQPSPAPPSAQLPTNGSISPAPGAPSNRSSFMGPPPSAGGQPGAPSRPISQPSAVPFVPQQGPPYMSGAASTFTPMAPRKSAAIQIKRPDGTALEIAAAKSAAAAETTTAAPTPVRPKSSTPVPIKMESEEGRKARLAEEAEKEKLKKEGDKSEQEKKDLKDREAKEAEEKRVADEAAKAKEESDAKEAEKAAEEKKKADEQAASKKSEEEAAAKAAKEESDKAQADAAPAAESSAGPSASTPASPNPAGLPAKPTASARRPAALELTPPTPRPVNAQPSAMLTAKPITDLSSVNYQAPIQSPSTELNKDAQPGKFRYDRDFLMQFMVLCMEKPDRLPPLEEIGLEADSSSGFGKRGGGRPSSGAGHPRNGLGISGGRGGSSMGNFGTGNFGSGQNIGGGSGIRGTTSQTRYENSLNQGGRGGRTTSQNMAGGRQPRNQSHQPMKRPPQNAYEPPVAPLVTTENSWVTSRPGKDEDPRSATYVSRKVKALLNKLTEEKFDSISGKILEFANYSVQENNGQSLKLVIKLIFEKATDEAHWSAMYAKLCKKMLNEVDDGVMENLDGKDVSGGALFRKYLVGRCQQDFESGWKERESSALKAAQKQDDDKQTLADHEASGEGAEPAVLSEEYYAAQKAKRRGLGLVQLIGELFKMDMVTKNVMKQCFLKLLGNVNETDDEDIESACKLLTTIGATYDYQSSENVDGIMNRLAIIRDKDQVTSRVKFMIMDVFDLRKDKWRGAKANTSVKTIAEIHQEAAKEQAQKSASAQQSMSRGGSRAGQPRAGDWQTAPSQAPRQRPTDFSGMGRLNSANNGAPTFQPQSAFGKNKRGGANVSTPPISRQPSQANIAVNNANSFALLNEASEAAESSEAAPQRKKLQLAPRTKPVDGEDGEGEGEHPEGSEESEGTEDEVTTPVQSSVMTETAALAKIQIDMNELWGEKGTAGSRNPDDIVHYFKALPEPRRPLLTTRLFDDVFRLAKLKDAQIIAKGLSAAVEDGVVDKESVKTGFEGRIVTLDDESIDFPAAYKAVASIIRSLSMTQEEIDSLLSKVDVYGEPKVTPKMHLEKALGQVDEEAASA